VSAKIVTAGPKAAKRWRCSTSATGSNCWTAAPSGSARLPTTCRADGMPPATAR
jgi:Metal-dependent hydrolase